MKTKILARAKFTLITMLMAMTFPSLASESLQAEEAQDSSLKVSASTSELNSGQPLAERILKANEFYLNGEFESSMSLYNQVLAAGESSFGLHFNMGNTAYRMGNSALALSHYLQAQDHKPRHPELQANIDLLKKDTMQEESQSAKAWFDYVPWMKAATTTEFAYLTSVLLTLAFLLFIAERLFSGRGLGIPAWICVALCSFCALGLFARSAQTTALGRGVVQSRVVSLHSEASEQSLVLFEVEKLSELLVLDEYPEGAGEAATWNKVRFDGNTAGWVPAGSIVRF